MVINENLKGRLHLRGHRVTWVAFCVCVCVCVCVYMLSHFSHIWLNDLMDSSLRGSPVHGFLQARTLEQVVITYSRGSSPSRDRTQVSYVSCIDRRVRYHYCHLGSPADIAMYVYNVYIALSHQLKCKSSDGKWLLGLTLASSAPDKEMLFLWEKHGICFQGLGQPLPKSQVCHMGALLQATGDS